MSEFKEYYNADSQRNNGRGYTHYLLKWYRKAQFSRNRVARWCYKKLYKITSNSHGIEIPTSTKIGKGFAIFHPYNITINPNCVIGHNCDIHKGCLLGRSNRGTKKGCPIIGDDVWIGPNVVIVGNITIGDDVLIAPNSFVNVDVPSHSVVIGNPCIIKPSDWATKDYINNRVIE